MRCEACGDVTDIDAATYFREERNRAHIQCSHCPEEIHFGPAVAALRSSAVPALNDAALTTLAWYHMSTAPDWPSPDMLAGRNAIDHRAAERHRSCAADADPCARLRRRLVAGAGRATSSRRGFAAQGWEAPGRARFREPGETDPRIRRRK
jgi:hypothetical protein